MGIEEITGKEAIEAVKNGSVFVDVREDHEVADTAYDIEGGMHIPLGDIPARASELPKDKEIIVGCRSGARSMNACMYLNGEGYKVKNLQGGIMGWMDNGLPTK